MVGSLCKKGTFHPLLQSYGMVIVDECHHAATDTMANVLQHVRARYIYGVTATPIRGDGLEKVNHMLMGPIRYRYTSKQRAQAQGIPTGSRSAWASWCCWPWALTVCARRWYNPYKT